MKTIDKFKTSVTPSISQLVRKSLIVLPLYIFASNTSAFNTNIYNTRDKPPLLLAKYYQISSKLDDFFVSEKLDGIRVFWNGETMLTRGGNIINAPTWFTENFPEQALDGELWINRNQFEAVSALARRHSPNEIEWKEVKFMAFDLPFDLAPFTDRLNSLSKIVKGSKIPHLRIVKQFEIKSKEDLNRYLALVVSKGGEGVMLHRKSSLYQAKRSDDLQKLKPLYDSEATVLRYIGGKGKYNGIMGSVEVINNDGIIFRIGSGFSFQERKNPPAIGSVITYQYRGKTKNNKPRFATFLREYHQH